ncbi:MAG: hypothetical protein HC822_07915 [Oscillochloris sp.]|nr:hypothetical protein [Oscillochloris sp.]
MTSLDTTVAAPASGLRDLLRRAWQTNRPLTLVGIAMIPIFVIALAGIIFDPRIITGQPAWLKPAKFAISIAIYSFTFIWMLGFVRGPRAERLARWAATITALAFVVEMVVIVGQVIRGTTSHFNTATPLDGALFSLMGVFIVILWAAGIVLAGLLLVQRIPNRPLAWGLRLGMILTLIGAGLGFLMTMPTPTQQANLAAGVVVTAVGAHSVAVPDGGPGLPVFGWSTTGGDLRVAHFIGLHAMQVVPLSAWLLSLLALSERRRTALVAVIGGGYGVLIALTAWQALRGQPLIAPDALTLAALGGLVVAVGLGVAGIVLSKTASRAAA